jgi:hypothetical protein
LAYRERLYRSCINLLFATAIPGCVTVDFKPPVASFNESVVLTRVAVGEYLNKLNQFERDIYLQQAVYTPTMRIEAKDAAGQPTALLAVQFSSEAIQARMDALSLLGNYADRLSALASSEAPSKFEENMTVLGTNLTGLGTTFATLKTDNDAGKVKDPTALNYIGPISGLVGTIGRIYLEERRTEALKLAVNEAAPQVRTIIDLIEKDLTDTVDPLRKTGSLQRLAVTVNYYNNNIVKAATADSTTRPATDTGLSTRRVFAAQINDEATAYDAAMVANPASTMGSLRHAHEALVTFANSRRTPTDLKSLVAALEAFHANAKAIYEQVKAIREVS